MKTNNITGSVRPEHAPTKESAPGQEGTKKSEIIKANSTNPDPVAGWFSLAANVKPARTDRHQKRGWNRGRK